MSSCFMKTLCAAGSVLLCGAMAVAFYHLVAKRGLGGRGDDEQEVMPVGHTGTVQHDSGGGFRMVENINLPSSGYSLLSVLVCLVAAAVGGFIVWAIYQKYIDWRAANETPPDMDMEQISPRRPTRVPCLMSSTKPANEPSAATPDQPQGEVRPMPFHRTAMMDKTVPIPTTPS
jgi:hypothetical protein